MTEWRCALQVMVEEMRLHGKRKLPPERQLAQHFGVARGTLRKELAVLASSGRIVLRPGRGGGAFLGEAREGSYATQLGNPPFGISRSLDVVKGVPQILKDQGFHSSTRILSAEERPATPAEQEDLGVQEGAFAVLIRRLRFADDTPLSLEFMLLPSHIFPDILHRELHSMYDTMLQGYQVRVDRADETISIKLATPTSAFYLGIAPGDPLIGIDRRAYDSTGRLVEVSQDLFRADITSLKVHIGSLRAIPS